MSVPLVSDMLKPFMVKSTFIPFLCAVSAVKLHKHFALETWVIGNIRSRASYVRRIYGSFAGIRSNWKRRFRPTVRQADYDF